MKNHRRSLAPFGLVWISTSLAAAAPISAATAEYSVHGKLLSPGGQAIAGAAVTAALVPEGRDAFAARFGEIESPEAGRTRSGQDGAFELVLPAEGFYRILIRADSYLPVEQTLLLFSPEPVSMLLTPLRPAPRIRVEVEDPEGKKLKGARIRMEAPGGALDSGAWQAFASTDENGLADLAVPAGENVAVYAVAPGFATVAGRLASGSERIKLRAEAGSPLAVEVRDTRGRPLPEVAVFLADARLPVGSTGKDGKVLVPVTAEQKNFGLADAAGREGLARLRPKVGEKAESPPRLRVELADPQPVADQVVDRATRLPVEGAWVFIQGSRGPTVARSGRTGHFELPRPYGLAQPFVSAVRAGYRQGYGAYSEAADEVAIELEPAARLEGRVVDSDGRPVAAATLLATTDGHPFEHGWPTFGMSRRDGGFVLADLPVSATVKIKAVSGRLASKVVEVKIAPGEPPAIVELTLASPASLAIRVLDPHGQPVGQAEVFALNRSDPNPSVLSAFAPEAFEFEIPLLGSSDGEGLLRVGELSPGSYDLAARASGFAPVVVRRVPVGDTAPEGAGEEREVELRLRPAAPVKGRVVGEDGEGVAGAAVYLTPVPDDPNTDQLQSGGTPSATTGLAGDFVVAGVDPERRFHLVASKDGYAPAQHFNLALGKDPPLIVLQRGGRVAGAISADGRHPGAIGIELAAEAEGETGRRGRFEDPLFGISAIPDAGGNFAFDQIRPGRYRLKVREVRGYQPFLGEIFELRAGETRVEEIELQKAAVVKGVVLLPDGQPAPQAMVSLGSQDERGARSHYGTDTAGRFRIETATPGRTWLKARAPGFPELVREIEILPGENTFELTLELGAIDLEAKVVDSEGAAVAGVEVFLAGRHQYHADSDANGRVRLAGLESGKYRLMILKEGHVFPPRELAVEESRQDLEWRLETAKARLAGAVLGLGEDACADLNIRVIRGDLGPLVGKCENGRYQIVGLAFGKQTLVAATTGRVAVKAVEILPGETETELDLDFRSLAGPWSGRLRLGDQDLRHVRYHLQAPRLGVLLSGLSADGRIELYADPGRYQLSVMARPMEDSKQIEIEIGNPTEQLIDASEP